MTNALRLELAPKNIRVGALHVARMDTDMVKADSPGTQNSRFPDIYGEALGHHSRRQQS